MSNKATKTALPKLRFPEFQDAGEWDFLNGNKVFEQITNKNHNSDLPILAITQEHGAIPRELIDYNVVVMDKSLEGYKVVEKGDFVISLRSFQGGIEYSTYKGICSPAYVILRQKKEGADAYFKQYFKTPVFIADLNKNIEGLRDGKMVSYKQFSELLLPVPSPIEQQKIATAISSLDELITVQSNKLKALQDYKRGLMQDLFPAERETVPKRRFPEFQDAGEWKEKTLKEISPSIFDGTHQTPKYTEGGVPFFSVENIVSGKANKFISKEDHLIATSKNKPEKGDILLTRIGKIGFPVLIEWDYEFSIYVTLAVVKQSDKFNAQFLRSYFQSERYQNEILGASLLNAAPIKINMDELRKTRVLLPPSEQEQQKIADCLSSLDNLITAQTRRIEALKLHKKGLMQALFPTTSDEAA